MEQYKSVVVGCRISFDIIQGIYCVTEAATTCTSILLLWHICIVCHSITLGICCSLLMIYWQSTLHHNTIHPFSISFLSTHPHWLQSELFLNTHSITFKQKNVLIIMEPQVPPRIVVNSKLPFLVLDVGSLICILQFRTQLSGMAWSEYGISSTGKPATWHRTGPVCCL